MCIYVYGFDPWGFTYTKEDNMQLSGLDVYLFHWIRSIHYGIMLWLNICDLLWYGQIFGYRYDSCGIYSGLWNLVGLKVWFLCYPVELTSLVFHLSSLCEFFNLCGKYWGLSIIFLETTILMAITYSWQNVCKYLCIYVL